jgi:hypothetical protein
MHWIAELVGPALFFSFVFAGLALAFYAMYFRGKGHGGD